MARPKLDSTIKELVALEQESAAMLDSVTELTRSAAPSTARQRMVPVLVRFTGELGVLEKAGFKPRTIAGDVASGDIALGALNKLEGVDSVLEIEAVRPMWKELNVSVPEVRADLVHLGPPSNRGAGVLVGIVDSGIDITHGCFRTAAGRPRIRFIWDQSLTPNAGEANPSGFSYGVEYTEADINSALSSGNPASIVRHVDNDGLTGHGSHVAGIAAGDGSDAGNGQPAFTFVGMAPEAELIVVVNAVTTNAIGDSASTLDGVRYIFDKAALLGRPVVINQSQGDNIGPHDGTSLLERGIDNLLGGRGRAMIKSAGNEGSSNRHAMGNVAAGGSETVRFVVDPGDVSREIIDLWYAAPDRFGFRITPPGGTASAVVNPGTTTTLNLPNGNSVFVDSVIGAPGNGDNRIFFTVSRGTSPTIAAGTWTFTLEGATVTVGGFHAWIERGNVNSTAEFTGPHRTSSHTISIPGTAREVITVGSYVNIGAGAGNLSTFSSRGPTRDGRQAPVLCAPGENVTSARAPGITFGTDRYHSISGTSMAAPHVAGAVALMLHEDNNLTQAEIRRCLENTARADVFTGPAPNNNDWGRGKLDAQAAVRCAAPGPKLKIADEAPTPVKAADDIATLKLADEVGTPNKLLDERPTLKFADEGGTPNKLLDEGPTLKFADEGGTPNKRLDDVKTPALDKNPVTDRIAPGLGGMTPVAPPGIGPREREPAPFVLASPHHSDAWARSYPGAFAQAIAQYQIGLGQLGQQLAELSQAVAGGAGDPQTLAALEQVSAEYRRLLFEYQQLAASAPSAGQAGSKDPAADR